MKDSKKCTANFKAPFLFTGALLILLVSLSSLYASSHVTKIKQLSTNQYEIQKYESAGDYGKALEIARSCYKESLKSDLTQETAYFSKVIKSLEAKLLTLGFSRILFDENFQPRDPLLKLLEFLGMEPINTSEKPILQINNWAQKNLLRQGERWQTQKDKFEELKPKIKPLLTELSFVNASSAHFTKYQGAMVHGGLLPRVRLRLYYLIEQWKQGVKFSHVYFLSGERPLDEQQENRSALLHDKESPLKIRKNWSEPFQFPKTESEMMQFVWDQSEVPIEMRMNVSIHLINAPMKKETKSEKLLRPTTEDTIEYWLKTNPPHGRYLAITNAPYINRQDVVLRTIAHRNYGFDTVGPSANEQEQVAIYLDELARFIYQTKQLYDKIFD